MNKRIFFTLFVATLIAMLGLGVIDPILPLYAKNMKATGIELGIIFAGFALSRSIFAPIIGQYSDRHGRKKFMITGLILFTVLSLCFVFARTPLQLTIIRIVQGFSAVMVAPVAQAYVGDMIPSGKEGEYMNLFFISFFAGMALGPYFGGYLTDRFNIEVPFYAMGALSFFVLVLVLLFVPESPATRPSSRETESILKSLLPVFKDKPMIGIMTYMFTRGFYRWGFNTFFPVLAVKADNLDLADVGLILSLYMLFGSLIQYPFGILVDKFPSQKVNFIVVGGICSAVSMCLIAGAHGMLAFLILSMSMGGFSAVARASAVAIRTERGRVYGMGSATGAFTTSLSIGQVLGPILFGVLADISSIPVAFLVGGVVGLAGTVASGLFFKSRTAY